MVRAVANFTSYLLSQAGKPPANEPTDTPTGRVLAMLKGITAKPLTEVPEATQLAPEDALRAIETLRKLNHVEVFEQGESSDGVRFLRLTSAGYAALADLDRQ